jgi:hypothetical protein
MKLTISKIALLTGLIFFSLSFLAQVDQDYAKEERLLYLIKKTDGNELYGFIISDDGREILLETKTIGKVYINKADIKEIIDTKKTLTNEDVKSKSYTEFRESGPFTTRYYFTNNALPVKKGEDYAMLHLFGPEIHFSLNDKVSMGVMATWIASPIGIVAKGNIYSKDKLHLSLGTIMASSGYINQARTFGGLHWLTMTIGDRSANFSLSGGYGYINWSKSQSTNFMRNKRRIGDKYSFSFYDPSHPYYLPDYEIEYALNEELYGDSYYNWNSSDRYLNKDKQGALIIGVSGIAPIGKKASFIFDSMIFVKDEKSVVYNAHDVEGTYERYDNNGNPVTTPFNVTVGKGEVVDTDITTTTILFMPAMRINQSYSKAFQLALAGVINFDSNGEANSFPFPMVSWLRKF